MTKNLENIIDDIQIFFKGIDITYTIKDILSPLVKKQDCSNVQADNPLLQRILIKRYLSTLYEIFGFRYKGIEKLCAQCLIKDGEKIWTEEFNRLKIRVACDFLLKLYLETTNSNEILKLIDKIACLNPQDSKSFEKKFKDKIKLIETNSVNSIKEFLIQNRMSFKSERIEPTVNNLIKLLKEESFANGDELKITVIKSTKIKINKRKAKKNSHLNIDKENKKNPSNDQPNINHSNPFKRSKDEKQLIEIQDISDSNPNKYTKNSTVLNFNELKDPSNKIICKETLIDENPKSNFNGPFLFFFFDQDPSKTFSSLQQIYFKILGFKLSNYTTNMMIEQFHSFEDINSILEGYYTKYLPSLYQSIDVKVDLNDLDFQIILFTSFYQVYFQEKALYPKALKALKYSIEKYIMGNFDLEKELKRREQKLNFKSLYI